MIAHLYLFNESFIYPSSAPSQQKIEEALKNFILDYNYIKEYNEENIAYFDESIFSVIIFPNTTIEDFLCYPNKTRNWDRDVIRDFQIIWDKHDSFTSTKAINDLGLHDENECFGLLGLHPVYTFQNQNIDPVFIIHNKYSWLNFRRYFLSLYPVNGNFFIDECAKYFPELFFHEQNKESVKKLIAEYPKKIIYYLSCLNDKLVECLTEDKHNIAEVLKHFSSLCKFDSDATLQGSNKENLFFKFQDKNGNLVNVCCEPHLKFHINDNGEELSRGKEENHKRIYFHFGVPDIQDGKILIGYIGNHL